MLNNLRYKILYILFYKNAKRSIYFYKLSTFIPFLYIPKVNFKAKSITENKNILYFNHFNRLYLYSQSLTFRFNKILSEYCIYPETMLKISNDDFILDCGANIGEFSLAFAHQFGVNKFICFEPDPSEFQVLSKNLNSDNVLLVNKALSNKIGISDFYLDNTTGDSSLLVNDKVKTIKIHTLTLDKFVTDAKINSIGFIKIEAEGFEPEILEGAFNSLKIIKYISVDCGFERYGNSTFGLVSEYLINQNFRILEFNSIRHTILFGNKSILSIN